MSLGSAFQKVNFLRDAQLKILGLEKSWALSEDINEDTIQNHLFTHNIPDPSKVSTLISCLTTS